MLGILDQETERMHCGLIFFPENAKLYFAIRGIGSFVEEGFFNKPQRLRKPSKTIDKTYVKVKRLKGVHCKAFKEIEFSCNNSETQKHRSSAYNLISIAEGKSGLLVMRLFHGHDSAIGSIIIEELGGAVVNDAGDDVLYHKSMPRMPLVIASLEPQYVADFYNAYCPPEQPGTSVANGQ